MLAVCYFLITAVDAQCPYNCSLAGVCTNIIPSATSNISGSSCKCDEGFTGTSCGTLDLAPNRSTPALYRSNASSWGGAVYVTFLVQIPNYNTHTHTHTTTNDVVALNIILHNRLVINGRYYMYAAVMANGCGLDTWECNSQCNVASGDSPQPLRCSLTRQHWWGAPTPLKGGSAHPISVLSVR